MYCSNCGAANEEGSTFCEKCGTALSGTVERKSYWRWFGYAWTIVINLITLAVLLGIYSNVYESFEIIVVSLLVFIYLSVNSFYVFYARTTVETNLSLFDEFARMRKLMKDEVNEYEVEAIQETKNKLKKSSVKLYINITFMGIAYLIALFNLFGAIG